MKKPTEWWLKDHESEDTEDLCKRLFRFEWSALEGLVR